VREVHVCNVQGGIPLSKCADPGAINVVTPELAVISNFTSLRPGQGHVHLADKGTGSGAEGYETPTLRSKSTGSTLTFDNVLYMPSAGRTLVWLGTSTKRGVFWHFNRTGVGYIELQSKCYWGDISLAPNDFLFLNADIDYP
jgi:hypothetical protein